MLVSGNLSRRGVIKTADVSKISTANRSIAEILLKNTIFLNSDQ
jgi:hypothetical protein